MGSTIARVDAIAFRSVLGAGQQGMRYFDTKLGRSNLLVVVHTDDGLTGMGESVTAPYFSGETARGAKYLVEEVLAPALIGLAPGALNVATARLQSLVVGNSGTRKAVEVALHDLAARSRGVSVAELLGGAVRDRFLSVRPLHGMDIDADRDAIAAGTAAGIQGFKIKVGKDAVRDDITRVLGIRTAAGPSTVLVADANQGWRPHEALRFLHGTRDADLSLLEQPLPASDLQGMARLVAAGGPPVAADEGARVATDVYLHARLAAADAVVLKLIKTGGLAEATRVATAAAASGLRVLVGGVTGETGLSTVASLHLAAVLTEPPIGLALPSHYVEGSDILTTPCQPVGGEYHLPAGPGLGVEVDLDAVEALRIDR